MANIPKYYTVKDNDTLWDIAEKYLGSPLKYQELAAINRLPNPDLIYVGQVLKLVSDSTASIYTTDTSKAVIHQFGLQSNSSNTLFATWTWGKTNNLDYYEVEWCYDTGDGVWFIGNKGNVNDTQSTYNIPSNAKQVKFRVKPVSTKYTKTTPSGSTEHSYWTANWSSSKIYNTSDLPPSVPSSPNVEIDGFKLKAEISNIVASELHADGIEFQIVRDDITIFNSGKAAINTSTNYVSYSCTVAAGSEYKVRCRSYKGNLYSDWSDYSSNIQTIPSTPSEIKTCKATSKTSIYLEWTSVTSATSYDIEYTNHREYFDHTDKTTTKTGITLTNYELVGLETGQEYFFRVRAVNGKGTSGWTEIKSVVIGNNPAAPTTWSSTTTAVTGEQLILYWVHNSEDNSSQTYAELELTINGSSTTYTIKNTTDEETKDLTSQYVVNTSSYTEGTVIQWRVRTAGITKIYGDWSIRRTINVYSPPTLELILTDLKGSIFEVLESFPFNVKAIAGPNTQLPISYNLTITSNEIYETIDRIGNPKIVNNGESVYSEFFDISKSLSVRLSAGDLDLENNISYTVTCVVAMNSGLTATASKVFTVSWTDEHFSPNAEIILDKDTLVTHIRPYCDSYTYAYYKVSLTSGVYEVQTSEMVSGAYGTEVKNAVTSTGEQVFYGTTSDGDETYYCEVTTATRVENVTMSVYRREFDGSFTELATGLDNMSNTFITDPHPSLDYARYRIVATMNSTGAVSYYDMPGYPVGEKTVIIQWAEKWTRFDVTADDDLEQPPWSGSLLKLPYNIDVSDNYDTDVSHVNYIGRKHPVSYYGTQVGETSNWKVEIDKKDKDTLYALRRLAVWMDDVYVREPSGSGYWATVSVSFSQTHCVLTIPVTLEVTRVEGGM